MAALILQPSNTFQAPIAKVHRGKQHALSSFQVSDVLAHFDNFSRNITTQNVRKIHTGQPLTHKYVEMIHSARPHPNQHLIFTRLWVRNVFVEKYFRSTKLMNANSFHGCSWRFRWRIKPSTLAQNIWYA